MLLLGACCSTVIARGSGRVGLQLVQQGARDDFELSTLWIELVGQTADTDIDGVAVHIVGAVSHSQHLAIILIKMVFGQCTVHVSVVLTVMLIRIAVVESTDTHAIGTFLASALIILCV